MRKAAVMTDDLICVDVLDRPVGRASKALCHRQGLLHRAFSVFLCDGDKILLQRRAKEKYHSGGLWANACCSHPRYGETLEQAVFRRLGEELGISCACEEIGAFTYYCRFGPELFEYEYDHVFLGSYHGSVEANPAEIMDTAWVGIDALSDSLRLHPERYAVWFLTAAPMVIRALGTR